MAVEKLNLSEHTLDINIRRCNYEKFDFSEIVNLLDKQQKIVSEIEKTL